MSGQASTLVHRPSPTASASVSSSSIRSQDVIQTSARPSISEDSHAQPNGLGVPPSTKRPNITHRLTRMFTSQGKGLKDGDVRRDSIASDAVDSGNSRKNSVSSPRAPSRQQSYSDKRANGPSDATQDRRPSLANIRKDEQLHRRFEMLPDGSHQHTLKSAKRQEKLSDMLREMLGGKKKDDHSDDHQQLSLMSNWVDQLRSERDRLAQDKKGGPNSTATLVQKYGKCQEIVGRGAFGIVRISHKVDPKDNKGEQLFAVKEFRRRPQESPKKYQKRLTSEFCISSSLRHPNVIHTLDLLQDSKGDYCEIMEFCAGGDLYTLVLAAGKLEVTEADCYFKQLMCGVEYLHEMGVAHRDLKPENLLLTTHGALKITDFGNGECFRMAWEREAHMTAGLCGSAPYIAPEEYIDKEFDPRAVDVWACGVIYMAMRTGRHLWRIAKNDEDEFFDRYLEGRKGDDGYGPIETLHRARCRNVIYSILDPDPSPKRRLTATKVLKSEWVREIKLCKAAEEGF
ncbi:Pkinase-domain-containing protein [Bacidia gigantensis]|uniref:Pkinase-domain-containing protein n=1 Tax=Bacidia gigantensis TaxID=2732470 RepID=UPI001D03B9C2|nr:Pkinase-domain-containing protein [Bacidia gigantensis]KAG8532096.1 Pkinase-domain-containing protein [Bacidia gigantensis]